MSAKQEMLEALAEHDAEKWRIRKWALVFFIGLLVVALLAYWPYIAAVLS